jgi:hypothetical protein
VNGQAPVYSTSLSEFAPAVVLQAANNLSDLTSVSTALTNLGIGTAATKATAYFQIAGNYLTALTGDGTATGPSGGGSAMFTLAAINSNTGAFGSGSVIPVPTFNGKGLCTGVTTANVSIPGSDITSGTVGLAYGGAGVNLSATGGTGDVLQQTSAGAAVSVGPITYAMEPAGMPLPRISSTTSASAVTIAASTTDEYEITALAASCTITISGTPADGQQLLVRIRDNGTAQALSWNSSYFASSGVATLLATTVAGKTHLSKFVYDSAKALFVCVATDSVGY